MAAPRLFAHVTYTATVQIEQRHAALWRRLKVMVPTHVPSSSDVASRIAFRSLHDQHLEISAGRQGRQDKDSP